jgi:hypothetical protein
MSRLEQDTARGIDLINVVLARSLTELDAPNRQPEAATPLAQCAAWHELEAARFHAMRHDACVDGDPHMARSMAEAEQMHAVFAVACREADGK